jgi:hypothetical protein
VIGPEFHIVTISVGVVSPRPPQTRPVRRGSRAGLARISSEPGRAAVIQQLRNDVWVAHRGAKSAAHVVVRDDAVVAGGVVKSSE